MMLVIDEFNSNIDFSAVNASILPENEIDNFIAGFNNNKSTLFEFSTQNGYILKPGLSIDVSKYDYIVCHFYSTTHKYTGINNEVGKYKIYFSDTYSAYIQLYYSLTPVWFRLNGLTEITQIKIEYLGTTSDRLFCSHCVAVKDELPLDIYRSFSELFEYELFLAYGNGIYLCNVNTITGQKELLLHDVDYKDILYLDRFSTIKIEKNGVYEIHTIDSTDEQSFTFGKDFDGVQIKNTLTDAGLYVYIPVKYNEKYFDYNVPAIVINGFDHTPIFRNFKIEEVKTTTQEDSGKLTEFYRKDDQIFEHRIQIICIDRLESNIFATLSQIIKNVLSRNYIWMNGIRFVIKLTEKPEYVELTDVNMPVVALIYYVTLEVKEEIWQNIKRLKTTSQSIQVIPSVM